MKRKGVETFNAVLYTTFFITFALFLLFIFLQVGVKEKGVVLGSLNSEHANRISNAINLIQTYEQGTVHIELPGKYIVKLSSKRTTLGRLYYVEVAYKSENNIANSKGFKIKKDTKVFPIMSQGNLVSSTHIDVFGVVSTKKNPTNKICIVKINDKLYIFDEENPTYTLPNEVNQVECALNY